MSTSARSRRCSSSWPWWRGALDTPHRLELLEHLAQGERSVEALAERAGLSVAKASQHLQHLRRAGLVANRREGKFIPIACGRGRCRTPLGAPEVAERNIAEVDRILRGYFAERDSLEPVSREELRSGRARAGDGARRSARRRVRARACARRHQHPAAELERGWPSSTRRARSSPIAAAPTASSPSKPSPPAGQGLTARRLTTASPNGAPPACRRRPAADPPLARGATSSDHDH